LVLTGLARELAATREHGFAVMALKERRRAFAEQIAQAMDRPYMTKVKSVGARSA